MNKNVKDLVFMAMYAALFAVLDVISNSFIPFLKMPNGGSIGISTVVLLVCSYHLGWKKAMISGVVSVLIQFVTGPMYMSNLLGFFLDYLFAFSIYGIASLFPNIGYFYTGVLITNFLRFVSHMIGGVLVWETTLWGSIIYNAPYMIATCIVGLILVPLIVQRLPIKH
ncbi:energy-coupled thiamine transporter ThiT [Merdibacter massiliensis]|uniref:energy-coupled thiamine transporter ThiT n=1 Tax=Merdibacter massiliensis TaxID=1871030 RepID=UPI00096AC23E|nr:energy-coupled thiamine transporter ThiT [Merdibacter massiliensis]